MRSTLFASLVIAAVASCGGEVASGPDGSTGSSSGFGGSGDTLVPTSGSIAGGASGDFSGSLAGSGTGVVTGSGTSVGSGASGGVVGSGSGSSCMGNIWAVNYDRSCVYDSDCVAVGQGNVCFPCEFECTSATISRSAEPLYAKDVAREVGTLDVQCNCPAEFAPFCFNGMCVTGPDNLEVDAGVDLVGDAWGDDATGDDAGGDAVAGDDAGFVGPSLDAGPQTFCSDAGTPGGTCSCDYTGDLMGTACAVDGLVCGLGCKPHCTCQNGVWGHCVAPPCPPIR